MQDSPLAMLQAANLYLFTMHNPVRWVDPSGLAAQRPSPQRNASRAMNSAQNATLSASFERSARGRAFTSRGGNQTIYSLNLQKA